MTYDVAQWVSCDMSDALPPSANFKKNWLAIVYIKAIKNCNIEKNVRIYK